ncbi:MAG TPA: amidohydrolase [Cytophagales bacterium]|jgi:L-fuconolactonase|nr:amidohydrolase [Cytophagales bacterium]
MVIDSHQHFWKYDPIRDAWINDEMPQLKKDFLPIDLQPLLTKNKIDGCVAIQADQSENETEFLLELAVKNSSIEGVVGWINLSAPNVEEKLNYFSKFKKLKGFRHIVQAEPDDRFMLRPDFMNGIRLLKKFNFTYDVLIYPKQFPAAIELVNLFPDHKFVIDHLAKPNIKNKEINSWKQYMNNMAQNKNVYCKISGMTTEANWKNWKASEFTPYLDVVFESFGVDRIMYGSDWPVCLLAATYEQQLKIIQDYIQSLTNENQFKVMGKNAKDFYNL